MDNKPNKIQRFVSRNLVTIVMIPAIIAMHYSWSLLQKNRTLVKEHEEIDLPVVTFYKYCVRKLSGNESPSKAVAAKTANS